MMTALSCEFQLPQTVPGLYICGCRTGGIHMHKDTHAGIKLGRDRSANMVHKEHNTIALTKSTLPSIMSCKRHTHAQSGPCSSTFEVDSNYRDAAEDDLRAGR